MEGAQFIHTKLIHIHYDFSAAEKIYEVKIKLADVLEYIMGHFYDLEYFFVKWRTEYEMAALSPIFISLITSHLYQSPPAMHS